MALLFLAGIKIIIVKQPFIGYIGWQRQIIIFNIGSEIIDIFCATR